MSQKSATVAVINNNKILLLRRGPTAKWKAGMYCLPGGKLEEGESLKDCALRELCEETNIILYRDQISPLNIHYKHGYKKIIFVANPDNCNVYLNWEHDHYIWIKAEERSGYKLVPGLNTTIKTLIEYQYLK